LSFLSKIRHKHQNLALWPMAFYWEQGDLSLAFLVISDQLILLVSLQEGDVSSKPWPFWTSV